MEGKTFFLDDSVRATLEEKINLVDLRSINTILFDLDETLSDHKYSLRIGLDAVKKDFPALAEEKTETLMAWYQEALDQAFARYLSGEITHEENGREKVRLMFRKKGVEVSEADIDHFLTVYREAYKSDRRATIGTALTLEALKKHGYKIGVVTNGQEAIQREKLNEIKIENLIDEIIVSETAGVSKPSPEIFKIALEKLGSTPQESLMIGDHIQKDIEGALGAGIAAILYSPDSIRKKMSTEIGEVPVIRDMTELLPLLGIG